MKRIFIAILAAAMAFSVNSNAQQYDYTRFGITGGVTSSSSKIKNVDTKSISMYHIGIALEMPLGAGFAIQPELLYQVKGLSLDKWGGSTASQIGEAFETKVGYLELPVQIQWGPDLVAFRPYGFLEPFVGYRLTQSSEGVADTISDHLKKVEYGLSLGAGIDIWKLQVSAKYFWNFGGIYDSDLSNTAETITGLKDSNTFNGVAVSVALFF